MKTITKGVSIAALALAGLGVAHAAQDQRPDRPDRNATIIRADAQAKAEAMFDRMDVNKDGKLDEADRAAKQAQMFDRIDTDHNGSISREEFAAAHRGMGEGPDHGPGDGKGGRMHGHRMGGGGEGHMGMMGQMADTNGDKAITKAEFVAAALKRFDQADANHDGKLTPDERKAAFGKAREHMKGMRGAPGGDMPPPPAN